MMRRSDDRRGQTLVEFALILPVFVLVLAGIFDGGRLVFAYHTVNNAAREGGREATVNQTLADIQARAAQHAVALDVTSPTSMSITGCPPPRTSRTRATRRSERLRYTAAWLSSESRTSTWRPPPSSEPSSARSR